MYDFISSRSCWDFQGYTVMKVMCVCCVCKYVFEGKVILFFSA